MTGAAVQARANLYICEDGLVPTCSQQPRLSRCAAGPVHHADVKREFLTAKSCSPNCHIGCVHKISYIDHWRAPQTSTVSPAAKAPRSS